MSDIPENEQLSQVKAAEVASIEQVSPKAQSPLAALAPLPSATERDLVLVDLPTEFDPDAELVPAGPSSIEVNDVEDTLQIPIRSIEDEDAEEAAELAELQKRRNGGQDEEGDEDDGNLEELLRGLQGDEDGEGEIEGGEDEILAELPQAEEEPEILLGDEVAVNASEVVIQPESPLRAPEQEDVQMESAFSSPLSDLPDLPSELPESPQPLPTPPRIMPKRILSPQAESHAESSSTAAKRARLASVELGREQLPAKVKGVKAGRRKDEGVVLSGKRARKQIQTLDFDEIDELESISDGDLEPGKGASKRGLKGANGKTKPASRKKKVDGGFSVKVGPTKGPPRPKTMNDAQLRKELKGKTRERQYGPCLRPRYKGWGKCTQCVAKMGGDSCRFRNFRMFKIDPDTVEIVDVAEFEYTRLMEEMTPLPREFNASWTESDIFRTERTIASMLLPVISREMRHAVNTKAVVRESDPAIHRGVCDFCSSTIFGGFFFCQKCGKDYCLQCERYFSDSMEAIRESPWDLPDAARPRLLRCTLAPPEKGTLAGKPPLEKGLETVEAVSSPTMERKSPQVEESTRGSLPQSANVEVPQTEDLPANGDVDGSRSTPLVIEVQVDDRPSSQLPEGEGASIDTLPAEPTSSDAMIVDAHPTDTAAAVTVDTQPEGPEEDSQGSTLVDMRSDPDLGTSSTTAPTAVEPVGPVHPVPAPRQRVRSVPTAATKRAPNFHVRPDLIPVTRFHAKGLEEHWYKLVAFVLDGTGTLEERMKWFYPSHVEVDSDLSEKVGRYIGKYPTTFPNGPTPDLTNDEKSKYYATTTNPSIEPIPDPAGLREKSHPFMFIQASDLDDELFDRLWARGEPIVVDKVGERFKQTWTPDTFIERFGAEGCFVIDCETEAIKETSVGQFFEMFKDPAQRAAKGVWKLKDWPSTHDFQSAYPDLYNDFCDSLPVPDFTRREGVLNLYAHFPSGPTKPDIGPKMYNAFEGKETAGGQGSTRLHMDVADAINIMLYASPRTDGQPGCAVWDLFKAEDADTIRRFLIDKYGGKVVFTDPIHSQVFYLDSELRKELEEKYGVVSFRVYQYPGQAVFIPAGCAHQVCNLADCIKIALDFVSPHNVSRCQQLMHDFRKENYIKAWKDDVLQLYNVMWFAWLNARETRERRLEEMKAPKPTHNGENEVNGADRPRWLGTQVSAVRDEPSSSPLQSRPPSPESKHSQKEDDQSKDRLELSKLLFEAMLLQSDTPPPLPVDKDKKEEPEEKGKDPGIRTSALVKMGVLPVDVAMWGVFETMKSEREDGIGGMDEFRMGLDSLEGLEGEL